MREAFALMRASLFVLVVGPLGLLASFIGMIPASVLAVPLDVNRSSPASTGAAAKYFSDGVLRLKKGDSKGAEALFRKSLELIPNHVGSLGGLAEALLQQGQGEETRTILQRALHLQPENGAIHRAWGRFLVSQKEFSNAEEVFLKAVQLSPKDPFSLIDLGNLYLGGLKRPSQSATVFAKAVRLAPNEAEAHFGLGTAYSVLKRPKEAIVEFNNAIRLAPQNPIIHLALGHLYREQKNFKKSLVAYTEALNLEPRLIDAAMAKGDLLTSLGRMNEAKQAYVHVIELDPGSAQAYNNLAWIAAEQKAQLDDGLVWAKRAVSLSPAIPQFKDTLAWVYRARGDLSQAAETLLTVESATEDPQVIYHLGVVFAEQGRTADAIKMLRKVVLLPLEPALIHDAEKRLNALISSAEIN